MQPMPPPSSLFPKLHYADRGPPPRPPHWWILEQLNKEEQEANERQYDAFGWQMSTCTRTFNPGRIGGRVELRLSGKKLCARLYELCSRLSCTSYSNNSRGKWWRRLMLQQKQKTTTTTTSRRRTKQHQRPFSLSALLWGIQSNFVPFEHECVVASSSSWRVSNILISSASIHPHQSLSKSISPFVRSFVHSFFFVVLSASAVASSCKMNSVGGWMGGWLD